MTHPGVGRTMVTASIIWGTERAIRTLRCPDSASEEALRAHRDRAAAGATCWNVGHDSFVLVASFVERAPGDSRDTPAWLVAGPLPLHQARELAKRADSLAYALQAIPHRTVSVPSFAELPHADRPLNGWSLRRTDGHVGDADVQGPVPPVTAPPPPPPGKGGPSHQVSGGGSQPMPAPQDRVMQYAAIAGCACAMIVSVVAIAKVRGLTGEIEQLTDRVSRAEKRAAAQVNPKAELDQRDASVDALNKRVNALEQRLNHIERQLRDMPGR